MKSTLTLGALGVAVMLLGPLGVTDKANAADRLDSKSSTPVSVLTEEDINRIVDQRVQDVMNGRMQAPPPKDFSQMPGLGETTQTPQRSKSQIQQQGVDWVTGGSVLQGGRTIYAKPFIRAPKTIVGGYMDFTISDCNHAGSRDCSEGLEFDQERFVPFFYSQITDRLSIGAEVEIEHGGPQGNQGDGDVKIEFATMDYRFTDWLNLRGGILLIPLGRFNLVHDSPLNDLPLRPMVSRLIIPSTFAESGIGIFGTVYPTQLAKVDYEFYVTQGFDGGSSQANIGGTFGEGGYRGNRGSFQTDNNQNKAIVSRISVSPILGIEVAGSVHHGKWDDEGRHNMTIVAVDGLLQRGPFEVLGEAAWTHVQGGNRTPNTAGGIPPQKMSGYYVQGNYHFLPDVLKQAAPSFFSDASTFTGVIRWGQVDTNTQSSNNVNDVSRLTFGLNFRPVEDAVIKLAYTLNDHEDDPGQRNGWQFSMATYF
ncbi:hypothetical protein [Nitrospira sp. M1]